MAQFSKTDLVVHKICMTLVSQSSKWTREYFKDRHDKLIFKDIIIARLGNIVTLRFKDKDIALTHAQVEKIREAFELCIFNLNGGKTDLDVLLEQIDDLT